jgi:hypothetical protein
VKYHIRDTTQSEMTLSSTFDCSMTRKSYLTLLPLNVSISTTENDFNLVFLTRKTTAKVPIVKLNKQASVPCLQDPVEVMGW